MSLAGRLTALWGIAGAVGVLLTGMSRVWVHASAIFDTGLSPGQWAITAAWVAFMLFFEGYRGFQKAFSPRVVARALYAGAHPTPARAVLAPLFSMGLFGARPRRMVVSWTLVVGITVLVVAVRQLDQPWRGIIDLGVVLGLTWGTVATVVIAVRAALGNPPAVGLDLPGGAVRLDSAGSR